jgi:tRNA threonylcarbamoyladenosine biosynthesis protein TsaB
MILLAIDTSTQVVGVALYDGTRVLSERIWTSKAFHTVELAPAIADMLDRSQVKFSEINSIAVALGPGSFTGLRIGLSLAKGMALARHLDIVGVPSLDILAAAQPPSKLPMVAILEAGRGRLIAGWYWWEKDHWVIHGEYEILTPEALAEKLTQPIILCGELGDPWRQALGHRRKNAKLASPARCLRRPSYLAELGWRKIQKKGGDDPATLSPFYLHSNEPTTG